MYRLCIFDLDGTLVNSIYAINHTVNLTLEEFDLGSIDEIHAKKFVGDGYQMLIKRCLLYCGDSELTNYEAACERYITLFQEHCMYQMEAYEGISELLSYIKAKGIQIAVLSNKPHDRTVENVEKVFGEGYFDVILGEKEGINRKPDPSGAYVIAKQLGVQPSECLYFGDTDTDMMTGRAAGMDTIGAAWGFRGREELEEYNPLFIADTPADILTFIRRNTGELC